MTKPPIDNNKTDQTSRLSVQISLTGLSFLVSSQDGDPLFFHEKKLDRAHTPEELLLECDDILKDTQELQGSFSNVQLIYSTNTYCTVPLSLFDENKASEYLKFNTKILGNDYIAYDTIKNHDMVVVYVPFININNYFFDRYGSFEYYHATSILLEQFLNKEKHHKDETVYLHVRNNEFDCIVIKNGALQLCNTYYYKTPEDFIYYVLFCFEQLKLNPDSVTTYICGDISKSDENFEVLYTYIRNISFVDHDFPNIGEQENHYQYILKTQL